jgi:hypothetical protein
MFLKSIQIFLFALKFRETSRYYVYEAIISKTKLDVRSCENARSEYSSCN